MNKEENLYEVYFDKNEHEVFKSFTLNPRIEVKYNVDRSIYTNRLKREWRFYLTRTFTYKFIL